MKNKEQVARHIANCKFTDEDWGNVLEYCKRNRLSGMHRAQSPKEDSTFQQFMDWMENGYGSGDIVRVGKMVGIVGDQLPSSVYLSAYIGEDGKIVQEDVSVEADKVRLAPKQERLKFIDQMEDESMMFNVRLARMVRKKGVKPFERVEFEHWGKTCYGIAINVVDRKADFAFIISDGALKQNVSIRVGDAIFRQIRKKGIDTIDKTLAENGLMWDADTHELVPVAKRAVVGGTYWYISEKFSVVSAIEYGKGISTERYCAGNYFLNFSEAFDLMMRIRKTINDMKKGSQ